MVISKACQKKHIIRRIRPPVQLFQPQSRERKRRRKRLPLEPPPPPPSKKKNKCTLWEEHSFSLDLKHASIHDTNITNTNRDHKRALPYLKSNNPHPSSQSRLRQPGTQICTAAEPAPEDCRTPDQSTTHTGINSPLSRSHGSASQLYKYLYGQ